MPKRILGSGWRFPISLDWNNESDADSKLKIPEMPGWKKEYIAASRVKAKTEDEWKRKFESTVNARIQESEARYRRPLDVYTTQPFSARDWNMEIAVSKHEEKIAESIFIILSTSKGERVMRPDFGCGIHDYVFAVINTGTLTQIKAEVRHALVMWEPRIEVMDVRTTTARINEGVINVIVDYRIRYTNTHHNLVYPFYLETQ